MAIMSDRVQAQTISDLFSPILTPPSNIGQFNKMRRPSSLPLRLPSRPSNPPLRRIPRCVRSRRLHQRARWLRPFRTGIDQEAVNAVRQWQFTPALLTVKRSTESSQSASRFTQAESIRAPPLTIADGGGYTRWSHDRAHQKNHLGDSKAGSVDRNLQSRWCVCARRLTAVEPSLRNPPT